ncbi:hypothetical protein KHM83_02380 [Fusibacter paucivorans]|uniref:Uncharacterized protein n=1 Tax=Fusibacter paucivorans TaxID=76009 RepID=A0ABS5PKU7_9FIRM|nr:hypothetical protein [Fusibacter paucivorans]MBS7525522.1 hypothetical protein [Fusibacter paucivorans]
MKKIIVIISFVVITFLIYSMVFRKDDSNDAHVYTFDFNEIDRETWFVGQWGGFQRAFDLVSLSGDILTLTSNDDATPYLLSKPIEIRDGDVITLKRHAKITHNDQLFAGGMAIYQTDDMDVIPEATDGSWMTSLGDGIVLVEYSYDLSDNQERPGKDIIRFLAADWEYNNNYQLINPIYDTWVDETLIYDTRSNQITYKLNDTTYRLNSYKLDRSNLRFLIHAYGEGRGNAVSMDQLSITVENKNIRR